MPETNRAARELRLSPAQDRRVRKLNGELLEDGEAVVANQYWQRRLADGDVVKFNPRKAKPVGASEE